MSSNTTQSAQPRREFAFTDDDFNFIRQVVFDHVGIRLAEHKRQLVYGRLTRRLRDLGLNSYSQYCKVLETADDEEIGHLVNAITTNVTSFYRESHHFEILKDTVVPERLSAGDNTLRVWSAGCSSGEEPYSIAVTLAEATRGRNTEIKILATDVDANCLKRGAEGVYDIDALEKVPLEYKRRWFQKGSGRFAGKARAKDELRRLITFQPLNLMKSWPMRYTFDVIFCRNVVIYFDKKTKAHLVNRYADMLAPGGYLFLGHSESLNGVSDRFKLAGRTAYKKTQ